MKASIKIVHKGNPFIGKDNKRLISIWTVITIDGIEYRRLFYKELKEGEDG